VGLVSMLTLDPFWLLGFTLVQGLLILGMALYVVVVIFAQRALVEENFDAGEIIFHEGDLGQHLYVIKSGTVEVLTSAGGGEVRRIKELGTGEHFGEMALLGNHPRNATIRTLTPVVLLKMGRGAFASLYTSLPGVQLHFKQVMEQRLRELEEVSARRS
jgi:CRP-like cAMP-binding protein